MSEENITPNPKRPDLVAINLPYEHKRVSYKKRSITRSTFTQANAETFRPIFDEIVGSEYKINKAIPWGSLGCSPGTLYTKVADALLYLTTKEAEEIAKNPQASSKYNILKNSYQICREEIGVVLRRRVRLVQSITAVTVGDTTIDTKFKSAITSDGENMVQKKWTDAIIEFIEKGKPGVILPIELAIITDEDKQWLAGYFANIGAFADYAIEGNTIKVCKI